ncbi:hypothetical protein Bbelb_248080 [Branchiostoma belcheri]|nr:hypothetical protein Bbelb_248080 [Branchiostoma belcheri]
MVIFRLLRVLIVLWVSQNVLSQSIDDCGVNDAESCIAADPFVYGTANQPKEIVYNYVIPDGVAVSTIQLHKLGPDPDALISLIRPPADPIIASSFQGKIEVADTGTDDTRTLTLRILSVTADILDSYRATVAYSGNDLFSGVASVMLALKVAPDPVLRISGYNSGVSAGTSLPLTCTSSQGNPPALVSWWKGGVEQQQAVYNSTPDASNQGDAMSVLTLAVQPANNQETYQCRVSQLGTELGRQDLQINVRFLTGSPSLTVSPGAINSGSSLTLTCTSGSSNPPASISWTRVGGAPLTGTDLPQTDGQHGGKITSQQVRLTNLQPQDNGAQFRCTATNSQLGQSTGSLDSAVVTINVRFYVEGSSITGNSGPVTSGGSLTLTCTSGNSNPPASISWTRVGGAPLTGTDLPQADGQHGGKITSQQVRLTNLQPQDNGAQFKCTVTNSDVSLSEEKTVTIDVQSESNPAARYSWIKDSTAGPLPVGAVVDQTAGTLTFRLNRTHTGEYRCTADNGISPTATSDGIKVNDKYAPDEPTIVSNTTTVEEGDSVQLTCQTTSNPPASYNWTRQSGELPDDARVETTDQNSVLMIPGLTKDDSGTYICTASNVVLPGGIAKEYVLTVLYLHQTIVRSRDVSIIAGSPQQATVRENTSVTFTCAADATPTANITWTGPHGELTNGEQLQLSPVERTQAGNYTCEASNNIKGEPRSKDVTLEIIVNYPASITSITPSMTVDEFADVSLTCTADSNPAPDSFSWTNMTDASLPGDLSNSGFTLTTTITNITYLQAGTYTCTAGNGIGAAASAGTNVTVEYAPKFCHPPDPYPASIGDDVSLECSAFAVPNKITFTWSKNGTTLTNSSRLTVQSSGETSILSISGVEEGDYGTYNCTAANEIGSSTTSRILQPQGPPGKPTGLTVVSKNAEFVVGITWTAGFNGGLDTTHTVQVARAGGGQWEDVGSWEQTVPQQHLKFDVNIDLKAQEAGDYQIRIRASNSKGWKLSDPVDLKLEGNQLLYGTLAITSEDYTEGVCEGELSNRIVAQLDSIFESYKGYEGAEVTACRSGSVLADFEATVAQSEVSAAMDTYRGSLTDGQLGEFAVDAGNSKISDTKPPAVVCGVVLIAGIVAGIFLVRRHATRDTLPTNSPTNMELERVPGDSDDGYQSLSMPKRQKETPEAAYEDVKAPSEFPRSQLNIKEELGQGEFGSVYKAEAWEISGSAGTTTVAVKELKGMTSPTGSTTFFKELSVLKLLGTHPNVVSFLGCCTDTDPFYLLLEYVSGGSLQSTLRTSRTQQTYGNLHGGSKSLSSRDLTSFAWDVAKGMTFLSAKKARTFFIVHILHRDLATRNVLVSADRTCKVSDFGFSREGDEYERTTKTRLPVRWMAPESLFHRKYTTKTGVWAFGVLLWEIVTLGATPYPGMSKREVMDGVQQGYRMDKPKHCDDQIYSLMMNCWEEQPMERPGFPELEQGLGALMNDKHGYINLAYFDENAYTSLQTSKEEKF